MGIVGFIAAIISFLLIGVPVDAAEPSKDEGPVGLLTQLDTQLDGARTNVKAIVTRIGEQEQEEANALKEQRLWKDQEQRVTRAVAPVLKAYLVDEKKYDGGVRKHETARRRVEGNCRGTLSRPVYERCQGEKKALDSWKGKLDVERKRLERTNKSIRDRIKPVREGLKKTDEKLASARKELSKLRDYLKGWNAHIRELERKLANTCQKASTCEALKHCRTIRWDGPRPNLPALPTDSPC